MNPSAKDAALPAARTSPSRSPESKTVASTLVDPGRSNDTVLIGILATLLSLCLFWTYQSFVTHYSFSGNFGWTLLFGQPFGLPEIERTHGLSVVTEQRGWDGQFYYHLANDPLQRRTETRASLDSAMDRGRRIFFPAMAHGIARLTGMPIVPPRLYLALHWLVLAIGVGGLVAWLYHHGQSFWWALPWATWWGVIHPTSHGLPEGACDALLLLALLALQSGRLIAYALCASALCLAREGYVVYAFGVWLLSALNFVRWSSRSGYLRSFLLTAVPGICLLSWTFYLSSQLQVPFTAGRTGADITSNPWVAWYKTTLAGIQADQHLEVTWKIFAGLMLLIVTLRSVANASQAPAIAAGLGYLLLTMCLGEATWQNYFGYSKSLGTVLLMGILLLPQDRSWWLRTMLAGSMVISGQMLYHCRIAYPMHHSAGVLERNLMQQHTPKDAFPNPPLSDVSSSAVWADAKGEIELPKSLWNAMHRESIPMKIRLENRSPHPWSPMPREGVNAIHIGVQVFDAKTQQLLYTETVPLVHHVPPGGSITQVVPLALPRGRYTIRVSGLQLGQRWFDEANPAHGSRYSLAIF